MPSIPVSVTFDDGNRIQYEKYFPILKQYGLTASFYVVTSLIGSPGKMNWDELAELYRAGNEIGSHTHTHPRLSTISAAELDYELKTSRDLLSPFNCKTIAYPFGDCNQTVIDFAKRYYIAGRSFSDVSTGSGDHGHNSTDIRDTVYNLRVFPLDVPYLESSKPLVERSAQEFSESIKEIIDTGAETGGWTIFVSHGWPSRKRLFFLLQRNQPLERFRSMCQYLEANKDVRVMTISDVVRDLH